MKAVLISIRPEWCVKIANGLKTIEVRKTRPKLTPPFKVYIYCTNRTPYMVHHDTRRGDSETEYVDKYGYSRKALDRYWGVMNGKIIGEFVCDRVYQYSSNWNGGRPAKGADISTEDMTKLSCMTAKELYDYENSAEAEDYCLYLIGLYGWHVSELKIYDKPKKLEEFSGLRETKFGYAPVKLTRPPQSWRYVEEKNNET